jgi:23S rRNA (uracil1939-C5)-methyltransferase
MKSFYQTNSDQAYELYKITRDFAGLTETKSCTIYIQEQELLLSLFLKKSKKSECSVPDAIKI